MDKCSMNAIVSLVLLGAVLGITPVEMVVSGGEEELRPVRATGYRVVAEVGGRRRQLTPFELCLECKCCSSPSTCITMPCCFAIDCQLPNKPFGLCAFVPKTCNCLSCSV